MTPLLQIRGLSAGYGPLRVLHDLDLDIERGERVGLVGLNGHGKSTLLQAIVGLTGLADGLDPARRRRDRRAAACTVQAAARRRS